MNFHLGAPPGVYGLVSQIDILLKDMHWTCVIAYAFPARNHMLLAFLLARLGKDVSDMLYTLDRLIGSFKELLGWDMVLE